MSKPKVIYIDDNIIQLSGKHYKFIHETSDNILNCTDCAFETANICNVIKCQLDERSDGKTGVFIAYDFNVKGVVLPVDNRSDEEKSLADSILG